MFDLVTMGVGLGFKSVFWGSVSSGRIGGHRAPKPDPNPAWLIMVKRVDGQRG